MFGFEQLERLFGNLMKLGTRRLVMLGLIGLAVFAVTGLSGFYLSRPSEEILYAGLERDDVSSIGAALQQAGIPFDVSTDGTSVLVHTGEAAQARMLLAEKGLPYSSNSGYELFDKLGSLGLTSFMQDITRVRALEGELARTIQTMDGVQAARVHIVLADAGSFRSAPQSPSAAVVIRTDGGDPAAMAQAIRHLVAGAVPSMTIDEVTVLDTDGTVLASGNDLADAAPGQMLTLEHTVSQDIQNNISRTLAPYLDVKNFNASVAVRLDTDKTQTNETTYIPDSGVERSVREVRDNETAQDSATAAQTPASVQQNLPQPAPAAGDGKQSADQTNKQDETTNYEISSKVVQTTSNGYSIDSISVAVLINRAALVASLGPNPAPDALDKQVDNIQQLVSSAAGLQKSRGDTITVSAVDFADIDQELAPVPGPSFLELAMSQSGTIVDALAGIVIVFLVVWFGLRPATRALLASAEISHPSAPQALPLIEPMAALTDGHQGTPDSGSSPDENLIGDLQGKMRRSPQKRLEQIVDFDEDQAAAILKQWIRQGGNA